MPVTHNDLEHFHHFASERLENAETEMTFDDLVTQCRDERSVTNDALREAFAQLDAGLEQPLDEAMEEIRQRLPVR